MNRIVLITCLLVAWFGRAVHGAPPVLDPVSGTTTPYGTDQAIIYTPETATGATQAITITYGNPSVTLGTVAVANDDSIASNGVTQATDLDTNKYTIAKTSATADTVTITLKGLTAADIGQVLTMTSAEADDSTYVVAVEAFTSITAIGDINAAKEMTFIATHSIDTAAVVLEVLLDTTVIVEVTTVDSAVSTIGTVATAFASPRARVTATATRIALVLKLESSDDNKVVTFRQKTQTDNGVSFPIPLPGGASTLTCGFSLVLALAVASKELMFA